MALAATRVEHEVSMEQEVVAPINSILDVSSSNDSAEQNVYLVHCVVM